MSMIFGNTNRIEYFLSCEFPARQCLSDEHQTIKKQIIYG